MTHAQYFILNCYHAFWQLWLAFVPFLSRAAGVFHWQLPGQNIQYLQFNNIYSDNNLQGNILQYTFRPTYYLHNNINKMTADLINRKASKHDIQSMKCRRARSWIVKHRTQIKAWCQIVPCREKTSQIGTDGYWTVQEMRFFQNVLFIVVGVIQMLRRWAKANHCLLSCAPFQ